MSSNSTSTSRTRIMFILWQSYVLVASFLTGLSRLSSLKKIKQLSFSARSCKPWTTATLRTLFIAIWSQRTSFSRRRQMTLIWRSSTSASPRSWKVVVCTVWRLALVHLTTSPLRSSLVITTSVAICGVPAACFTSYFAATRLSTVTITKKFLKWFESGNLSSMAKSGTASPTRLKIWSRNLLSDQSVDWQLQRPSSTPGCAIIMLRIVPNRLQLFVSWNSATWRSLLKDKRWSKWLWWPSLSSLTPTISPNLRLSSRPLTLITMAISRLRSCSEVLEIVRMAQSWSRFSKVLIRMETAQSTTLVSKETNLRANFFTYS